jgi:hypothetical protein
MPYGYSSHLAFYLVLYIGPYSGWVSLPLSNFIFVILRVEVRHVLDFNSNNQMMEGGDLCVAVIILLDFNEKFIFQLMSDVSVQI